jgi:hypothetical protein
LQVAYCFDFSAQLNDIARTPVSPQSDVMLRLMDMREDEIEVLHRAETVR